MATVPPLAYQGTTFTFGTDTYVIVDNSVSIDGSIEVTGSADAVHKYIDGVDNFVVQATVRGNAYALKGTIGAATLSYGGTSAVTMPMQMLCSAANVTGGTGSDVTTALTLVPSTTALE